MPYGRGRWLHPTPLPHRSNAENKVAMRLSKLRLAGWSAVVAAVLAAHLAIVPAATAETYS